MTMRVRRWRAGLVLCTLTLCTLALAGCGDSAPTGQGQRLAAVGRIERGATVRIVARDGASAADSMVSDVTVVPASAGIVTGTSVRLLQSGSVTVSARARDGQPLSTALDVVLPPTVYFDAIASGNRDVYSVALDGGELKRWTTAAGDDAHPSVVAGTMVFSTMRHGNAELYALSLATSAEQRLTTTAANETEPSLAKSGTSVAFVSDAAGGSRVYVAAMPFANPARLTASTAGSGVSIETSPSWSPTADRIALMSTVNGRANLFIAPSAPGSVPAAVNGSGAGQTDVEPVWSPDGNFIAFASSRAGGSQIFVLDLRTGAFRQLTSGASDAGQPGWLADGRVVFTLFAGSGRELWWVDPATTEGASRIPTGGLGSVGNGGGGK